MSAELKDAVIVTHMTKSDREKLREEIANLVFTEDCFQCREAAYEVADSILALLPDERKKERERILSGMATVFEASFPIPVEEAALLDKLRTLWADLKALVGET